MAAWSGIYGEGGCGRVAGNATTAAFDSQLKNRAAWQAAR
jgi:hypothetical protein